jgi:hypothetical protein
VLLTQKAFDISRPNKEQFETTPNKPLKNILIFPFGDHLEYY